VRGFAKPLLCAVLVGAALVGAGVHAAPAAAAGPCWKTLLTDWYDGRIDNTYAIHCYQDALDHLPADVQTYSSAHDDILRALQNAKARLRASGTKITPNTDVPPEGGGTGGGGGSGSGGSGGKGGSGGTGTTATTTTSPTDTSDPGRSAGGGLTGVGSSDPSSVPVPLLVLGGLAILLVAAGAAGLLAKRFQNRKPPA
jgi:hypothetical protein